MLTYPNKYISDLAMKNLISLLVRILVYNLRTLLLFVYMCSQSLQLIHHPHIDHKYSCCININYRNQKQWTLSICILDPVSKLPVNRISFLPSAQCYDFKPKKHAASLLFNGYLLIKGDVIIQIYFNNLQKYVWKHLFISPPLLIVLAFKKVLGFSDCSLIDLSGIIILSFKIILRRLWKCLLCKNNGVLLFN